MKRKIAAILAADVAGYSKLVAEDEEETLRRLAVYQSVFSDFVERFGGRIFNTAGDAVLAEFASAVDAVRCAVDVQETLRARNLAYPASRHMSYRIGITIGDVVEREGDLLGDGVNVAARLEGLATPGGICISRSVHEAVASKLTLKFSDAGVQRLKNMPEPVHTYTVDAGSPAASNPISLALLEKVPPMSPQTLAAAAVMAILAAALGLWILFSEPPDGAPPAPQVTAPSEIVPPKVEGAATATADTAAQLEACRETDAAVAVPACKALIAMAGLEKSKLAEAHTALGQALRRQNDTDGAIQSFSSAIDLVPSAAAYVQRGVARFDKGQSDEAVSDLSEALKLDAKSAEAANARAWIRYQTGDLTPALADADLAIELDPSLANVWDTRGHINEALGKKDAAVADFRQALEIDPDHESSKTALTRLGAGE